MDRVTQKQLENLVQRLNRCAGTPETKYTKTASGYKANPNHYYIQGAYGGWKLEQVANEGGGAHDPIPMGFVSKRCCYELVDAFRRGMEVAS